MSNRCASNAPLPTAPAPIRANHDVPLVGAVGGGFGVNWPRSSSEAQPSPMRLYVSRTQSQLHTGLSAPVAMVQPMKRAVAGINCLPPPPTHKLAAGLPLKRPLSLANAEVEDSRPPTPKQLRRCRPASPAIATNPLCRRRSRDVTSSTAPVAELPDRHQSAVANVAFPTLTPTPLFQQTVAAAAKRDAQTSPREHSVSGASTATPTASGGGVSLTNWVRSARCRLARLRRSFSTPRVDFAVSKAASASTSTLSGSDAPTPKRLFGGRKRHASLQRLVQRLAASPVASSAAAPTKMCSPTGNAAACVGTASPTAVSGRVLKLLPDGSRMVRLKRQRGGKFGFFVSRQQGGVYLSRFNDPGTQRRYRSVLGVGDQILEIEGMSTTAMPLDELHRFISDKRALLIRVRSCYPW